MARCGQLDEFLNKRPSSSGSGFFLGQPSDLGPALGGVRTSFPLSKCVRTHGPSLELGNPSSRLCPSWAAFSNALHAGPGDVATIVQTNVNFYPFVSRLALDLDTGRLLGTFPLTLNLICRVWT